MLHDQAFKAHIRRNTEFAVTSFTVLLRRHPERKEQGNLLETNFARRRLKDHPFTASERQRRGADIHFKTHQKWPGRDLITCP
jgi:hypothetical protein